ncbi:MAG: toll/interleukin-1 receptor domain-containing protein [Pseudomonadota bacterium]
MGGEYIAMPDQADQLVIFVSYSRAQVHFADELELYLTAQNHRVLIDRHGISKGENFQERLGEMILDCDTVVFILSDESAASEVCAWEIEEALRLSKRILVITLKDLSPGVSPPEKLAGIDWIHCWNNPAVPGSSQTKGLIELDTALRTDVQWLRQCTEYQRQAANWARRGKKPESAILLRDDLLAEALEFAKSTPANEDLPDEVAEYFAKSSEYQATLNSSAVTRAKAVRRTGLIGAAVSAVFFVVAMGFGYIALQERDTAISERNEATRQSNLSFSRALSAQAATEQNGDLDLSLLLSIEAFAAAPTAEARSALLSGLTRVPHVDRYLRPSQEIGSGAIGDKFCSLSYQDERRTFGAPSIRGDGFLDQFDLQSGQRIATLPIEGSHTVAVSPDGARAAYYTATSVRIVNLSNSQIIAESPLDAPYGCVLFGTGSDTLYFSNNAEVYVWNFTTGAAPDAFTIPRLRAIHRLSPSADGRRILAAGYAVGGNQKATVWVDFEAREIEGEILDSQLIAHDRGRDIAAIANPTGIYTFDLAGELTFIDHIPISWSNFEYGVAALAPTGDHIAIWHDDRLSLRDLKTGAVIADNMAGYSGMVEAILFEPDGAHFITMGRDDLLTRWRSQPQQRLLTRFIGADDNSLQAIAPLFEGPLGTAETGWLADGNLEALDPELLDVLAQILTGTRPDAAPTQPAALATATDSAAVPDTPLPRDVLDVFTRIDPARYQTLTALAPDRTAFAAISKDNQVHILDARTTEVRAASGTLGVGFADIALLSPTRLLAITEQNAVWQCDADGSTLACRAFAQQPPRKSLQILPAASPAQAYILGHEEISLLDLERETLITNLARGSGLGAPASASLDEVADILAFTSGAPCVSLYDPKLIFPFASQLCPPVRDGFSVSIGLAFNPAGDTLLSGHSDGLALWDLSPDTLIQQACAIANRGLTETEWQRYMGDRPLRQTC